MICIDLCILVKVAIIVLFPVGQKIKRGVLDFGVLFLLLVICYSKQRKALKYGTLAS